MSSLLRTTLLIKSFWPSAVRFAYRHPVKINQLWNRYRDYLGRFSKVAQLTGQNVDRIEQLFYEVECEQSVSREFTKHAFPLHPVIYHVLVRLVQPCIVVETGVNEGWSSLFKLLAMERNKRGTLYSIDLPNADFELGPGMGRQTASLGGHDTGYRVPLSLQTRWQLQLGDAKDLLPRLLNTLGAIDVFIHDSLHSYNHMLFEFSTAWSHLKDRRATLIR